MGKHSRRVQEKPVKPDISQGLAWRGIGCLLMLIIPAISIVGALVTIDSPLVRFIPPELMGRLFLPAYFYSTAGLTKIFAPITNINNLSAIIFVSVLYMILLGGVISVLYAFIYRAMNPKRYGEFDAPPPKATAKKYKR